MVSCMGPLPPNLPPLLCLHISYSPSLSPGVIDVHFSILYLATTLMFRAQALRTTELW